MFDLNKVSTQRRRRRKESRAHIDFQAINECALFHLPELLHRWVPDGIQKGREWIARNPRRTDHRLGSFCINLDTGKWADFATDARGGDVVSLAAYLAGMGQAEAAHHLAEMLRMN
jgi:ribosomal protein L32